MFATVNCTVSAFGLFYWVFFTWFRPALYFVPCWQQLPLGLPPMYTCVPYPLCHMLPRAQCPATHRWVAAHTRRLEGPTEPEPVSRSAFFTPVYDRDVFPSPRPTPLRSAPLLGFAVQTATWLELLCCAAARGSTCAATQDGRHESQKSLL